MYMYGMSMRLHFRLFHFTTLTSLMEMFTGWGQRSNGCCFLFAQSDEPEEHGPEIIRLLAAKGNHKKRIAKLTAMREVDVIVTTVEHNTSVRLPVGVLVDMSCVAARVSMLWWPPSKSKGEDERVSLCGGSCRVCSCGSGARTAGERANSIHQRTCA